LIDLMAVRPDELPALEDDAELYGVLRLMRSVFREEEADQFVDVMLHILKVLRLPENRSIIEAMLLYALKYGEGVSGEQVSVVLSELDKSGETEMGITMVDRWKAEASQDAIIRVLKARRFEISDGLCEKLRAIQDIEKLQQLTDLAATTESIADFESKL